MALTLARPEGNPPGGKGLALFYLEIRDEAGEPNGLVIHRLKDKLGTRMLPTAELDLVGARAVPVMGLTNGVKNITTMLNMTRTWNAVAAVSGMRRALDLARDWAAKRVAFGAHLTEKPLHAETLADIEALYAGAFLLTFRVVELLGREENGALSDGEEGLLRLLTPIAKLTTGKQAIVIASEALEAFGGRRLHRGHGASAASQGRAGAAALGRDDERSLARPAPRDLEGRRTRSGRTRNFTMPRGSPGTARTRGPVDLRRPPARGGMALPRSGHGGARSRRAAIRPDRGPRRGGRTSRGGGLAHARRAPSPARRRALRPPPHRFDPGRRAARGSPGASRSRDARSRRAGALTASA